MELRVSGCTTDSDCLVIVGRYPSGAVHVNRAEVDELVAALKGHFEESEPAHLASLEGEKVSLAGLDDYEKAQLEARTWRTLYRGSKGLSEAEMADIRIGELMEKQLDYEQYQRTGGDTGGSRQEPLVSQPEKVDHLGEAKAWLDKYNGIMEFEGQICFETRWAKDRAVTHALIASAVAQERIAVSLEKMTGCISNVDASNTYVRTQPHQ